MKFYSGGIPIIDKRTLTLSIDMGVLTGELVNLQKPINVSNLEKGFYYLSIADANGGLLKTIKLVK